MNGRLFTSPVMTGKQVKEFCQMVRENKGKVQLFELELKSALLQLNSIKTKAAS